MKYLRKFTAILMVLIMCASLCACGEKPNEPESAPDIQAGFHTVSDWMGREVAVPDEIESIACLYAYTGHAAVLLGCQDKIEAVVTGLKRDALMREKVPNIDNMPSPYSSGAINIEELAAVSPDLVFLRESVMKNEGEKEKIDSLGIPYMVIEYETLQDQLESIRMMGEALGREEKALAYIDYYEAMISMVEERISQLSESEKKRVYHSVNEAVRTDIPGTLSYEVLEAAGCDNVVSGKEELKLDGDKGFVTTEQIYVWDPDVLLVNEAEALDYFKNDSKFSGLRAVREGNIIQLPVGMSRWAHPGSLESPLVALFIAKSLYPELFEDISMEDEIKNFYGNYLEIQLSDEEVQMILSGSGMRAAREAK